MQNDPTNSTTIWNLLVKNYQTLKNAKTVFEQEVAKLEQLHKADRLTLTQLNEKKAELATGLQATADKCLESLKRVETQVIETLEKGRTLNYKDIDEGDIFFLKSLDDITVHEIEAMAKKYKDNFSMSRLVKQYATKHNLQVDSTLFFDGAYQHEARLKGLRKGIHSFEMLFTNYKNPSSWRIHSEHVEHREFLDKLFEDLPLVCMRRLFEGRA